MPMRPDAREQLTGEPKFRTSFDVYPLLDPNIPLARNVSPRMTHLLDYLKTNIHRGVTEMRNSGRDISIAGPVWSRTYSEDAGQAHADVIIGTYGDTYALPNKDPKANAEALRSGDLDMFLIFNGDDGETPVGTACMVAEKHGLAELGRAASTGRAGNRVIQDMRILRWLTDENVASKFHTLFATCRTAPDRNIGTPERPEIMRGGQAVAHIWQTMPEAKVAGFGPLYLKHGALEQFGYTFITKEEVTMPKDIWVYDDTDADFVSSWLGEYGYARPDMKRHSNQPSALRRAFGQTKVHIEYPPHESGVTELVHGEIELGEGKLPLQEGIRQLAETGVPFMQVKVPVDHNTVAVQKELIESGFQAFQFTPGLRGVQSPMLWFGKVNGDVPVVPTFWGENSSANPFWHGRLAQHATRIAENW